MSRGVVNQAMAVSRGVNRVMAVSRGVVNQAMAVSRGVVASLLPSSAA